MEDIVFGSDETRSAREEFFFRPIIKMREEIISSCGRCNSGFIERKGEIKKVEDLANDSAYECECRKKADLYANMIKSGIPWRYLNPSDFRFDSEAGRTIKTYLEKKDRVLANGVGMIFFNTRSLKINIEEANTAAMITIMKKVLTTNPSHYISAHEYFTLVRNCATTKDEGEIILRKEIEEVDFLFVDHMGSSMTAFVASEFEHLIRSRISQCRPTLIATRLSMEDFSLAVGEFISGLIESMFVVVGINKFSGGVEHLSIKDL